MGCSDYNSTEPITDNLIENNRSSFSIDINSFPYEEISDVEKAGLIFMREEEKLARDIYKEMFHLYGAKVFNNIATSEQTHMNSIKLLLDKYSIEDPVLNDVAGNFNDSNLQNIYNELFEKGSVSLIEAMKVGAVIEEIDIVDLQRSIESDEVNNEDILFVYNNLLKGSANHLRSFVRNLNMQGVSYSPQYLDNETYSKILNGQI
ncbi:MAG: DUF2202 domain-containing protein [Ignavibacteria bacterium]|nr:DUF2202 domain-containing protein [Ignavibacteria bacterium]